MLHHLSIAVADLARAMSFYDAVLIPLGYARVFTGEEAVGYGYPDQEDLLLLNLQESVTVPGHAFIWRLRRLGLKMSPVSMPQRWNTVDDATDRLGRAPTMATDTMPPS